MLFNKNIVLKIFYFFSPTPHEKLDTNRIVGQNRDTNRIVGLVYRYSPTINSYVQSVRQEMQWPL